MKPIELSQIEYAFDNKTINRALEYLQKGKVLEVKVSEGRGLDDYLIASKVKGQKGKTYQTQSDLSIDIDGDVEVVGLCSCPMGYNCKHVLATLLSIDMPSPMEKMLSHVELSEDDGEFIKDTLDTWLYQVSTQSLNEKNEAPAGPQFDVVYELKTIKRKEVQVLIVTPKLCRRLKKGGYGKPQAFQESREKSTKHLQTIDYEIIPGLGFVDKLNGGPYWGLGDYGHTSYILAGPQGEVWLKKMIDTGRAFWFDAPKTKVVASNDSTISLEWQLNNDGSQSLITGINQSPVACFFLENAWYVNPVTGHCGIAHCEITKEKLNALLLAPTIPATHVNEVRDKILAIEPELKNYLPEKLASLKVKDDILPTPILTIEIGDIEDQTTHEVVKGICMAKVAFKYEDILMPFSLGNTPLTLFRMEKNKPVKIIRNQHFERTLLMDLEHLTQLVPAYGRGYGYDEVQHWVIPGIGLEYGEATSAFTREVLPKLENLGWQIERNHPIFQAIIEDEDLSWFSEINYDTKYDFFGFRLGVEINGERTNILPMVSHLLQSQSLASLKNKKDDEKVELFFKGNQILSLPFCRIKPILNILIELYDTESVGEKGINLLPQHAYMLNEINEAYKNVNMQWIGGDKLLALGKKLVDFKKIKTVKVPKSFAATLRDYQQTGVNWLQFLREHQLSGVLADDMGLGKTIQTLAHLSIEKSKKRLNKPSLLIAPTSLMVNWKNEAARFASDLKVLVYHGDKRKALAESFSDYHLVLSTYPLLVRDKDLFLENDFYYLILDEAQYIKNEVSKAAKMAGLIKASHRICLTGTPMENHLGELWSIFNFLMPGFLGSSRQFKSVFRNPIEKDKDFTKQKLLANRVKPFMLRRLKNDVVLELPKKTEIIRSVALSSSERDLYESIRLSMEKKVHQAIHNKGLARSHIVILDALLKLRQVCCHPKLLSLEAAKKVPDFSAKLDLLMDMLPQMIAEGRRVLIFSQFTKMLSLIEESLEKEQIDFVKLTGATKNREKVVNRFQSLEVPVFLISLKAGGTGLNLTAADTVIHFDLWWNPAVEDQASDRSYRIGQDKPVFVYKLITEGTVEGKILEMQQDKRRLTDGIFSVNESTGFNLSEKDLEDLFKPI